MPASKLNCGNLEWGPGGYIDVSGREIWERRAEECMNLCISVPGMIGKTEMIHVFVGSVHPCMMILGKGIGKGKGIGIGKRKMRERKRDLRRDSLRVDS